MRKTIMIFLLGMFPIWVSAQYYGGYSSNNLQIKNQFTNEVNMVANAVGDCVMSFFDNPYHHSNTKKIYDLMEEFEKVLKDYNDKYWSLNISDDNTYYIIQNSLKYVKIVSALTGGIGHDYLCRFDSNDFETMVMPVLSLCKWEWKVVASSDYAIAYEFQHDKFRMVLVKNILPATPPEQAILGEYNDNLVRYKLFYYDPVFKRETWYLGGNVKGGKYTLGQYVDDETTEEYHKTTKITSELKK